MMRREAEYERTESDWILPKCGLTLLKQAADSAQRDAHISGSRCEMCNNRNMNNARR